MTNAIAESNVIRLERVVQPVQENQGGVVDVSPETDFTQLANQLLDAMCEVEISGRQYRVFLAIVRKTIGFKKHMDWISVPQLAEKMKYGSDYRKLYSDLDTLVERRILVREGKDIGVNLDISQWLFKKKVCPKRGTKVPEKGHKSTSKRVQKCPKQGTNVPQNGNIVHGAFCPPNRAQVSPKTGTKVPENGHIQHATSHELCAPKRDTMYPKTGHKVPENGTHLCPKRGTTKDKIYFTKDRERAKRATPPPEIFSITDDLKSWAKQKLITVDLNAETEKFLDYHHAKGSRLVCWKSAWRNWIRKAQEFNPHPRATATTARPQVTTEKPEPHSALELAQQGLRNHRNLVSDAELQAMLSPKHPSHQFGLKMHAERQAMLEKVQNLQNQ